MGREGGWELPGGKRFVRWVECLRRRHNNDAGAGKETACAGVRG